MKIAFIVLTYNRSDALLAVLRALAPQCRPDDVVVVADDGSREEHVRAFREQLPSFNGAVRHVWHPDQGFTAARARNLGAASVQADYLVFLDGDCIPHARFAQRHRELAEPGAFVNGSRVLLSEPLTTEVLARRVELQALSPSGWLRLRARGDVNKLGHLFQWPAMPGRRVRKFHWRGIRSCNFGLWYRDFEAVNGFDETFSGWGHEDADLVLRLHKQGLIRKNGHLATEVFHLWHRQNSRAGEAANRARVMARLERGDPRADIGLAEARNLAGVVVNELSRQPGEHTR